MKLLSAFTALLCAFFNHGVLADSCAGKLAGTWIEAGMNSESNTEGLILEFTGNREITINNLLENPVTVRYEIPERPYMKRPEKGAFSITYTHRYKKMSSGILISTSFTQELYYHEENGLPILSETNFEHDGCGLMITSEYLPKDRYVKGFTSELSKKINDSCTDGRPRGR